MKLVDEPLAQDEPLFTEYSQVAAPEAKAIVTVFELLGLGEGKVTVGAAGAVVSMISSPELEVAVDALPAASEFLTWIYPAG